MTTPASLQPVIIVIFGITGDLAQRKLLPALYHLLKDGLLHKDSVILGITRRTMTADELLGQVELCVNEIDQVCDPEGIRKVRAALRMHQMSQTDGADDTEYDELLTILNDIETERGICMNRLYYLAIPPKLFESTVSNLGQHGLNQSCQHDTAASRLLVEKPFGYDTASAETLIKETSEWFREDQIFRIDHYVAKETVQNILAFRTYNPLFSSIWNRRHIASITITAYEQITIEGRAVFYEGVGALRDFIQSHLLQLLTAITMELPEGKGSDAIHAAKQRLLKSIVPIGPDEVAASAVRGQYDSYRQEVNDSHTNTETYAALSLDIDNDRWRDVAINIRTGKAMARKHTEIRIVFTGSEGDPDTDSVDESTRNELIFNIQPSEGISLHLHAKKPGFRDEIQPVIMNFAYQQAFDGYSYPGGASHPDAYERVLVDAARGDHTLFTTSEEVLEAWRIIENVLRAWGISDDDLIIYPKGAQQVA